ncbi:histidine phosphatase family protein [Marisediminicola sp. LYQ134]|uniref:histidine phosphatase family protein n=1 Tax=unclassified Marisediminicola TaxID=2618316 RepID=UPI003983D262
MAASFIHLVRHGEVHNPEGVLYGRLPGYHLSERGTRMAAAAAAHLAGRPVTALYASPLHRAQESAAPWVDAFGIGVTTDHRLIEPHNKFEGEKFEFGPAILTKPRSWPWVVNPFRPSWGEPFTSVASRMIAAIDSAWRAAPSGDVVMVSHQMPIVMVQRAVAGVHLWHDPRQRRCSLSSVTTLERVESPVDGAPRYREVAYAEPAADLLDGAIDTGAV